MTEKAKDVYSFLVPMLEDSLLLPNTVIAEIVPFMNVSLDDDIETSKNWRVGSVVWRNQTIPVIALERLQGTQDLGDVKRSRIAICYTLNGNEEIPFVALMVRGIPRLIPIDDDNAEFISDEIQGAEDGVKAWVNVNGKKALIPDLDFIESRLESA
ncbi:chemotaxis protein CheW [Kangiella marina]|uniref:Chemotaxis protein CheW n=1 Tax=Kangiella marina TaxID=1079178 RepID=A0ABP8IKJ9_9GAMM